MALAAMTSTNTVTATLTNWFYLKSASSRSNLAVGFRKTIKECSQNWLGSRCLAGLDIMHAAHSTKQLFFIAQAFEALARTDCRSAIRQAQLQCESLENDFNSGLGD